MYSTTSHLGRQAREFLVSASHQLALTTSLPFVHTVRRSYRLNDPVNLRKDHCRTQETERPENDETSLSVGRFLISPNLGTKSAKENATKQPAFANPEMVFVQKQCCKNPVNHRVFERKLHPKPSGRGHVCLAKDARSVLTCGGEFNSRHIVRGSGPKALDDPKSSTRPLVRRDHPLSLSISISGGNETNKDSLIWRSVLSDGPGRSSLERGTIEAPIGREADGGRLFVPVGCGMEQSGFECEHAFRDPKDGEICLSRAKPEETLVEARSDTDVQIVRLTWVGRGGCFVEASHGIESSKWAIFGKKNWRCGMNRKPGYGAQLCANLEPTKGVGRLSQQDGASPGGAAVGADLGGSSKYSNENFEGRRGERFHVNGTCTSGVRRRRREFRKELSFLFNSLPTLETAQPEVGSSGWKSTARRMVLGAFPAALENLEDRVPLTPGKGSRQNGSITSGKGLALRAGLGGPSSEPVDCWRAA
ncbi:hypothetical protein YC2023_107941 [Brassica napus]